MNSMSMNHARRPKARCRSLFFQLFELKFMSLSPTAQCPASLSSRLVGISLHRESYIYFSFIQSAMEMNPSRLPKDPRFDGVRAIVDRSNHPSLPWSRSQPRCPCARQARCPSHGPAQRPVLHKTGGEGRPQQAARTIRTGGAFPPPEATPAGAAVGRGARTNREADKHPRASLRLRRCAGRDLAAWGRRRAGSRSLQWICGTRRHTSAAASSQARILGLLGRASLVRAALRRSVSAPARTPRGPDAPRAAHPARSGELPRTDAVPLGQRVCRRSAATGVQKQGGGRAHHPGVLRR